MKDSRFLTPVNELIDIAEKAKIEKKTVLNPKQKSAGSSNKWIYDVDTCDMNFMSFTSIHFYKNMQKQYSWFSL